MKERPILFSAPMVRALLDGTKTQTRRVVDVKLPTDAETSAAGASWVFSQAVADHVRMYSQNEYARLPKQPGTFDVMGSVGWIADRGCKRTYRCPFGVPGDRLWVRETFFINHIDCVHGPLPQQRPSDLGEPYGLLYRADGEFEEQLEMVETKEPWRPSIHMPRWASRITLEITDVRVERVQAISSRDALDEGIEPYAGCTNAEIGMSWDPVDHFRGLWDSINAKRAPWSSNPWVWALTFRRVTP